jgi:hypothetical protein
MAVKVPTFDELMNPLLTAMQALGGSGSVEEIYDKVVELERFPDDVVAQPHDPEKSNQTELGYRLAWARTYLKKYGLLENSTRGIWALTANAKGVENDAEALQHYFPERDFVPLMEVLATVNRHTGWMEEFQHWQQRHHHRRPADRVVYAGVIGIGCTIGIRKMARISHPISESELENAVNWFFSVDNINAASDRVLQLMDRLELPKLLQRTPGRSHTSSDGQKFEVRVDSLNANHSFKYFGKEQGVSVYTFRDERDLLWHSLVFSAADRESAYVIDGLMPQ